MSKDSYTEISSKAWDKYVGEGDIWTVPIDHETYIKATAGIWEVVLTPCKPVPKEWFIPLKGAKVLGLASAGGQQCPIFTANGADVTVFDNSVKQLEQEKVVSDREGYNITLVRGDMTKRLPFDDNSFDMIFHPVSNCFIRDVCHVWNEAYRVLKPGCVLLSGFNNPIIYIFEDCSKNLKVIHKLPVDPISDLSDEEFEQQAKTEGIEFSHSLETQITGQIKAGFILADLYEDKDWRKEDLLSEFAPSYIATKAIKP